MSDVQDDELRIALVSYKARADEEDSRQSWKTFFWSVCFYASFQFFYVMARLADPEITLDNLPWENFSSGIGSEEATSIVLGLAAFIVTINVAVFAARLAPPLDDVSVLDLARWQRRMQFLAPRAGQVAIAISLTQLAVPALGLGLLLISLLAVTAADLRIAGRLSALQMEVDSAKKFSDHAEKEFERLKSSFRSPLLAKVEGDSVTSWNKASALVILPIVSLVTAETLGILILWQGDGVFLGYGLTDYFDFYLWFAFVLWGVLLLLSGSALNIMIHAAAGRLVRRANLGPKVVHYGGLGTKARWGQWIAMILAAAFVGGLSASAMLGPVRVSLSVAAVAVTFLVMHLLIEWAFREGRGPGLVAVRLAVADRFEEMKLAEKRYKKASAAHEEALRVEAARAAQLAAAAGEGQPALLSTLRRLLFLAKS